jgi:hypothetical protein
VAITVEFLNPSVTAFNELVKLLPGVKS